MFPILALCSPLLLAAQQAEEVSLAPELHPGALVQAGGQAIDVTVGHASPYCFDYDGDGLFDLLVGEFGELDFEAQRLPEYLSDAKPGSYSESRLRIYRNVGKPGAPRFEGFEYLQADGGFASIPST